MIGPVIEWSPANRNRPRARRIEPLEIAFDVAHASLIVHGLGQGNIAEVMDARHVERRKIMNGMGPPVKPRNIAHRPRAQVLVAFRRTIARTVRNANERYIAGRRILVPVTAEKCRDAPPIPALGALLVVFQFVGSHVKRSLMNM